MPTLTEKFEAYWNEHHPSYFGALQSAKAAGFESVEEAQEGVRKVFLAGAKAEREEVLEIIKARHRTEDYSGQLTCDEIERQIKERDNANTK